MVSALSRLPIPSRSQRIRIDGLVRSLRLRACGSCARRRRVIVSLAGRTPGAFVFRERRYTVERAYGPWVTGGDWWSPSLWGCEQWDLVARAQDGALLCCCLVRDLARIRGRWWRSMTERYIELHAASAFSFLEAASQPERSDRARR